MVKVPGETQKCDWINQQNLGRKSMYQNNWDKNSTSKMNKPKSLASSKKIAGMQKKQEIMRDIRDM